MGLMLVVLFTSFISADILITSQPKDIYNLGDVISVPVTIKATSDISGLFQMDLVCNGNIVNFYKNGISLNYGEEIKISPAPSVVLTQNVIGKTVGKCKIKAIIGDQNVLTNEFTISNILTVYIDNSDQTFNPSENMIIEGTAIKNNQQSVDGFIEMTMYNLNNSENITQTSTISNGFFNINLTLPGDIKAGEHLIKLYAYEKDNSGEIANRGTLDTRIIINQIPKNLEILFENKKVEPGTDMNVKAILRDQTGDKIDSTVLITLKNNATKTIEEKEVNTDEYMSYPIKNTETPLTWSVYAKSGNFKTTSSFVIAENENISIKVVNKTIVLENIGNVEYCNKTILIKIDDNSENINPCLDVGEEEKYLLKAPNGEYIIEIISNGESLAKEEGISLTGKAISVEKASQGVASLTKYPLVWIFLVVILGMIAALIFKKGYKRTFFGHLPKKGNKKSVQDPRIKKKENDFKSSGKTILPSQKKAVLSLSLKGEKQRANVIDIKIKNIKQVESGKGGVEDTMKKIASKLSDSDVFAYENTGHIMFIFAPSVTKTFKNERPAIKLAQEISKILDEHNKLFKQTIEYGISIHEGDIVGKHSGNTLMFMSMDSLMPMSKKLSSLSNEKIILSKEINSRLSSDVKTQKHEKEGFEYYTIKEMIDREEHKQFINSFLKKLESEKKKK